MILETNGPLIAEKVTSHSMDAESPLTEQVMQHSFSFLSRTYCFYITDPGLFHLVLILNLLLKAII